MGEVGLHSAFGDRGTYEVEGASVGVRGCVAHPGRLRRTCRGCPRVWGMGGACNCGLTAVRDRLRRAVLDLVMHYGIHDAECPAVLGNKCDCGLDSARRRLRLFARPLPAGRNRRDAPPDGPGRGGVAGGVWDQPAPPSAATGSGRPAGHEGPHYDTPLADAANEALEELLERVNTLPGDQQVGAMTMIAYGMVMEHLRLAS